MLLNIRYRYLDHMECCIVQCIELVYCLIIKRMSFRSWVVNEKPMQTLYKQLFVNNSDIYGIWTLIFLWKTILMTNMYDTSKLHQKTPITRRVIARYFYKLYFESPCIMLALQIVLHKIINRYLFKTSDHLMLKS